MKTNLRRELLLSGLVIPEYCRSEHEETKEMIEAWKAVCNLPEDVKVKLPYFGSSAGVGYELKRGEGEKGDKKENFDFLVKHAFKLQDAHIQLRLKGEISKEDYELLLALTMSLEKVDTVFYHMINDFAAELEEAFQIQGFAKEVRSGGDSGVSNFIRLIHYFDAQEEGEEIASAHVDQSGFTLHLFESTPGLQCLRRDKVWVDLPFSENETAIIPSMQLQLRSKGVLEALPHRVVATPESIKEGRYSAVCFVQLRKTPQYDKKAHGRLQLKVPGFNFGIPHEEFEKLFKS